jgi:pilus assembly protein CpaB
MRAKSLILLLIALGCGVVASVAVSQVVLDQKGQPVQMTGVLVASKNISAAAKITEDSVRLEQYPIDRVPYGVVVDLTKIRGKFAKQPIYANEPILEVKLANKGKELIVPDGYRVFDIVVSDQVGGSGYIGPGDRVDVFGFFEKGVRISSSKSVKIMENLEVLMVDGVASIDPDSSNAVKRASTIQLLVKDKQYAVLDTASNLGRLRLALRPPQQDEKSKDQTDEGEKFMSWLKETETGTNTGSNTGSNASPILPVTAPAAPSNEVDHEMVIVTPEGKNTFQWKKGDMQPRAVKKAEQEDFPAGGIQSGYTPPSLTLNPNGAEQNDKSTGSSISSQASSSPNMTWDPNSGNWQVGGVKASYPATK